jgi:UDP-glucuronate 4-epimerase
LSAPAKRRALVTGGAGFIGSTLVERLLHDGWDVTAVDSFDPYYPRARKERNLEAAGASPAFQLVEADTRDADALRAAFDLARPEVVFDLAARAGVRPSIADPGAYVATNLGGFQHTLTNVARHGARLVFASSSSIYGVDERRPFREDQARGRPISPYGATKVAGEALAHAHHAVSELPVGVARLFTVYGPRQRPDLAIHAFARRMLGGQPIELFDEGRPLRDYTYVDDLVDALVRLAAVDDPWLVVNLGSDRPIAVTEMVAQLERALGVRAERRLLPAQPGDVPGTHADISRAEDRLGWRPTTRFEDGIDRFCAWLRAEVAEEPSVRPG